MGNFNSSSEVSGYYWRRRPRGEWDDDVSIDFCKAIDIAVGPRGHVFCLTDQTRNNIYSWTDRGWENWGGVLERITVDRSRSPYGFNKRGGLYGWDDNEGWESISRLGLPHGSLTDIAIGGLKYENFYVIGPSTPGQGGLLYKWQQPNGPWAHVCGDLRFTRITVDAMGFFWAINSFKWEIYTGSGYTWNLVPGRGICDIAGGYNIYLLGKWYNSKYGAYVQQYDDWQQPYPWKVVEPLGLANNIGVSANGYPWVTNNEGKIFRYVKY